MWAHLNVQRLRLAHPVVDKLNSEMQSIEDSNAIYGFYRMDGDHFAGCENDFGNN